MLLNDATALSKSELIYCTDMHFKFDLHPDFSPSPNDLYSISRRQSVLHSLSRGPSLALFLGEWNIIICIFRLKSVSVANILAAKVF